MTETIVILAAGRGRKLNTKVDVLIRKTRKTMDGVRVSEIMNIRQSATQGRPSPPRARVIVVSRANVLSSARQQSLPRVDRAAWLVVIQGFVCSSGVVFVYSVSRGRGFPTLLVHGWFWLTRSSARARLQPTLSSAMPPLMDRDRHNAASLPIPDLPTNGRQSRAAWRPPPLIGLRHLGSCQSCGTHHGVLRASGLRG